MKELNIFFYKLLNIVQKKVNTLFLILDTFTNLQFNLLIMSFEIM